MKMESHAFWSNVKAGQSLFGVMHQPENLASDTGVILVHPIGPEYMHSHRSVKALAHALQAQGVLVIRFDLLGMGNSSGSLLDKELTESWVNSIDHIKHKMLGYKGINKITFVSLRSGSLPLSLYLKEHKTDGLVFWYPYTKGAAFNRDMQMIDQLKSTPSGGGLSYHNAGGYPLSEETQSVLKPINLTKIDLQINDYCCLFNSSEQRSNSRLKDKIAETVSFCEQADLPGLSKMAKQAELSIVPQQDIEIITSSICSQIINSNAVVSQSNTNSFNIQTDESDGFKQKVIRLSDAKPLFGVLTQPETLDQNLPLVLIINGGGGHHVGPNRLHVELAYKLAETGFSSFRFDLSRLGESPLSHEESDNFPYPKDATEDIHQVINFFCQINKQQKFIIAGLCSGAHNAFHAQLNLEHRSIVDTILINPLTFYLQEGDSILEPEASKSNMQQSYYKSQAGSLSTWLALIKNPQKIKRAILFVLKFIFNKLTTVSKSRLQGLGLMAPNVLARDIKRIIDNKKRLSFFISNDDPGYAMIMQEAKSVITSQIKKGAVTLEILESEDHTFSSLVSREKLIEAINKHLVYHYK